MKFTTKNYLSFTTNTIFGISLPRWLGLLAKNRFAFDIRFLPKILFITGNVVINIPLQIYEYLRYNRKIKKAKVDSPLFILGHPRSGTTYLLNVLSKDPNFAFCATYEALTPYIFLSTGKITKKILAASMPETRPQDNVKVGADMPVEEEFAMGSTSKTSLVLGYYFPKSLFRVFDEGVVFEKDRTKYLPHWKKEFDHFLKKLSYKYGGKKLLLKSPANTGRMKEIFELYPDAKFIHIHREPYSVYQSNLNLYEKVLPVLGFQAVSDQFIADFVLYSYEKMNRKYLEDLKSIPANQVYEINYKSFVAAPMEELEKAYKHLGLEGFEQAAPHLAAEIKGTTNYKSNAYTPLDEAAKAKVREQWGFMFDRYGYKK